MNFIRAARFDRPEIVVIFFTYVALWFYIRHYKTLSPKKYLVLMLIISGGIFAHFLLGTAALGIILLHQWWMHRSWKTIRSLSIYMVAPIVLLFLLWSFFVSQTTDPETVAITKTLWGPRFPPNLYLFKVALADTITHNYLTFIGYLAYAILFTVTVRHKQYMHELWIIAFLGTVGVVVLGSAFSYAGNLPILFLPLAALILHNDIAHRPSSVSMVSILIFLSVVLSLVQLSRLLKFYGDYSYTALGEHVSQCIPQGNHNVYFTHISPHDPYFYLVANRPQLNLAYRRFQDYEGDYFRNDIDNVDYIITYGRYALLFDERLKEEAIPYLGFEDITMDMLMTRTNLVCTAGLNVANLPRIAVFKVIGK
jgi:hypothetical protein